jgi:hypothetical protein
MLSVALLFICYKLLLVSPFWRFFTSIVLLLSGIVEVLFIECDGCYSCSTLTRKGVLVRLLLAVDVVAMVIAKLPSLWMFFVRVFSIYWIRSRFTIKLGLMNAVVSLR